MPLSVRAISLVNYETNTFYGFDPTTNKMISNMHNNMIDNIENRKIGNIEKLFIGSESHDKCRNMLQ